MRFPCVLVSVGSPAVPKQALQDVGRSRRAEDGPLDAPVFEVAAVDLVGTEPLFNPLLDTVALGEAHGARSRGETVIHEVHRVLKEEKWHEWVYWTWWHNNFYLTCGERSIQIFNSSESPTLQGKITPIQWKWLVLKILLKGEFQHLGLIFTCLGI